MLRRPYLALIVCRRQYPAHGSMLVSNACLTSFGFAGCLQHDIRDAICQIVNCRPFECSFWMSFGLFLLGVIARRIVISYKSATRDWNNNTSGQNRYIGVIIDVQYSNAV